MKTKSRVLIGLIFFSQLLACSKIDPFSKQHSDSIQKDANIEINFSNTWATLFLTLWSKTSYASNNVDPSSVSYDQFLEDLSLKMNTWKNIATLKCTGSPETILTSYRVCNTLDSDLIVTDKNQDLIDSFLSNSSCEFRLFYESGSTVAPGVAKNYIYSNGDFFVSGAERNIFFERKTLANATVFSNGTNYQLLNEYSRKYSVNFSSTGSIQFSELHEQGIKAAFPLTGIIPGSSVTNLNGIISTVTIEARCQ